MALVFYESSSELATLTNTFSVNGTPTDPTTISLTITTPAQVSTTHTYAASQITRTGTGVYTKDIACTEAGEWTFEWVGTGAASDVQAGTWTVFDSSLGKLYASVASVKSRLKLTTTADDYEVHDACFAASRAVEQLCERTFYRSQSETRTFIPCEYEVKLPEWNDLVSVSAFATDATGDGTFETSWSSTDYQLLPHNTAGPETKPFTKVKALARTFPVPTTRLARDDRVQITGIWGWPAVPSSVVHASRILAAELFKLKDAPFGVVSFGELGLIRAKENPKVMSLLGPYQRNAMFV